MSARRDPRAGFTLIETLVALVVLAVVAVVAQRGMVTARLGLDRARSTLAAEAVARSIVETGLPLLAQAPGVREGVMDGLAWTVEAEPIALPLPAPPPPARLAVPVRDGEPAGVFQQGDRRTGGTGPEKEAEQAPQARWRPLRVRVTVANGRGRPLTVETLHLAKAP